MLFRSVSEIDLAFHLQIVHAWNLQLLILVNRIVHPTWIRTPLIDGLTKSSKFRDFCLEPETVADAIVNQLYSGYGGQLILPSRLSILSGARGFPSWLQESLRNSMSGTLLNMQH